MTGISAPLSTPTKVVIELAEAGYLPLSVSPSGKLRWDSKAPSILKAIAARWGWADPYNPFVRSALYTFEHENGLALRGFIGGHAPLAASMMLMTNAGKPARHPWAWVLVHRAHHKETVSLYEERDVPGSAPSIVKTLTTPANTGYLDTTPLGTWTIDRRYRITSMAGSTLVPVKPHWRPIFRALHRDGLSWTAMGVIVRDKRLFHRIHYDDHDIKWVSYFHRGDALHYFPRAHYGFPQSAGCVEMPEVAAKDVWNRTFIGTPVTVVEGYPRAFSSWDASRKQAQKHET